MLNFAKGKKFINFLYNFEIDPQPLGPHEKNALFYMLVIFDSFAFYEKQALLQIELLGKPYL